MTATRTIKTKTLKAGETTDITVKLVGDTKATALIEVPPNGWTLARGTDNAFAFKDTTKEWVWKGTEGELNVIYTLTAPKEIPVGTYHVAGNVMHADGVRKDVEGDKDIVIVV